VPIGWESRSVASWDPAVMEKKVANWLAEKMDNKYPVTEDMKPSEVPFGWGNRLNHATMEDLSLSKTAVNIAIAELHLKEDATDLLNVKKYSKISHFQDTRDSSRLADANMNSNNDQLMSLLVNAIAQMDAKMTAMQQTLGAVEKKVEHLTNLLQAVQNRTT
jgi:hypothetical protein